MAWHTETYRRVELAVQRGDLPRAILRAIARIERRRYRRPARISRMHAAYGRRTR